MAVLASFTCALVLTAALDLHDIDEIAKVSLLQTRLQTFRGGHTKGSSGDGSVAIPCPPTGTNLISLSPHKREDSNPHKLTDLARTKVEGYFIGKGVWQRYPADSIPKHLLITNTGGFTTIMKKAPTVDMEEKLEDIGQAANFNNKAFYITLSPRTKQIVSKASATINGDTVHDVYGSILIGSPKQRKVKWYGVSYWSGPDQQVWAPGLSQVWVALAKNRVAILGFLGVAADGEGANIRLFPGGTIADGQDAAMSFQFTAFSDAKNPIVYTVVTDTDGFPKFEMHNSFHSSCPLLQVPVTVKLDVKIWGNEIFWKLEGKKYGSYQSNKKATESVCLYRGEHSLQFMDTWGDGWHGGTIEIEGLDWKATVERKHKKAWQTKKFDIWDHLEYGKYDLSLRYTSASDTAYVDKWKRGGVPPWFDPAAIRQENVVLKAQLIINLCNCYKTGIVNVAACLLNGNSDLGKAAGGVFLSVAAGRHDEFITRPRYQTGGGSWDWCWK